MTPFMLPIRSEQEQGTGVTLATGRPRFVMRMPSGGKPSSNWRHCSRKSLTFNVFIPQSVQEIVHFEQSGGLLLAVRPETWVTERTGDMSYTFSPGAEHRYRQRSLLPRKEKRVPATSESEFDLKVIAILPSNLERDSSRIDHYS